jgi:hypothetical protein
MHVVIRQTSYFIGLGLVAVLALFTVIAVCA